MKLFKPTNKHTDERRDLMAFRLPSNFPRTVEGKMLIIKKDGVKLGNHSHPHTEGFFLVTGSCTVRTWTKKNGVQEHCLKAPVMFMFFPNEEHLLFTCSRKMTLVGYMPITFKEEISKIVIVVCVAEDIVTLKAQGFDAVQIHIAHGHSLNTLLSSYL